MSPFMFVLMQFTVLAYALVGGAFLTFSDFVMRSLAHTRGVGGVEAMQVINREVFRWVFMTLFLGMTGVSMLILGYAWTSVEGPAGTLMLWAALVYLVGCFAVTVAFNVPMNEALAGMDPKADGTLAYWQATYVPRWTFFNTLRTLACVVSAALMLRALAWVSLS
ncbi:anthrone oxygenase family protein [Breoghania sp.]|uniref:anthrone oxygenase family protein n=1 Tax=Breoghania sp. TaxID=2065378 RepID=UPI0029CA2E90|nr:anthrone oxygenase family protein [Breoghania sp.]